MRFRWILIGVFLAALVSLGILNVLTYQTQFQSQRELALSSSTASAKFAAAAVESFLSASMRASEAAGQISTTLGRNSGKADVFLDQVRGDNPSFSSIALITPGGRVLARSPDSAEAHVHGDYLKRLSKNRPWYVTSLERFNDGSARFHILVGIYSKNKLIEVVDTTVRDSAMYLLVKVRIGAKGNVGVIDQNGRAVALTFLPKIAWNQRYRGWIPSISTALRGKAATITSFHDPLGNIDRMGASVPVPGVGWVVNVFRPVDEVVAPIVAVTRLLVLRTLFLSIISLVALLLLTQLIAGPLSEMGRATEKYGRGDLGYRIRENYFVDEISELATAFNKAAASQEEQVSRERYVADTLQRGLLPAEMPEIPGYDVGTHYSSATKEAIVGGDFFEFIDLGGKTVGIAVGDVQGHGVDAAITTVMAKLFLRDIAGPQRSPAWVMQHLNEALCRHLREPEQLITMVYLVLNYDTGFLTYCSAGHPPPVVCGQAGMCRTLEAHQDILGFSPEAEYLNADDVIAAGEFLCLYTDGVLEARRDREQFGMKRLKKVLARGDGDATALAERVYQSCLEFSRGDLRDDLAVVVVKRK